MPHPAQLKCHEMDLRVTNGDQSEEEKVINVALTNSFYLQKGQNQLNTHINYIIKEGYEISTEIFK